jgi:hypothetical protein
LKSLTAVDLGAGSISSISYQAKTPIEKQLAQLSLHLDNPQDIRQDKREQYSSFLFVASR